MNKYVIILKGKRGDQWALKNLHEETFPHVIPLLEPYSDLPGADEALRILESLRSWEGPLWLDQHAISGQIEADQFRSPLVVAGQYGLQLLPVLRLGSPTPMVQAASENAAQGVVFRLVLQDFADSNQLAQGLAVLQQAVCQQPSAIDLVLDFGGQNDGSALVEQIHRYSGMIPEINAYRSLTVAAGAFPDSISFLKGGLKGPWHEIARSDWIAYQHLLTHQNRVPRLPDFGDYGPRGPGFPNTKRLSSPNLRYSVDSTWRVRRGRFRHNDDVRTICRDLVQDPAYLGVDWSAGDAEIHACAKKQRGPGTGEHWTRWAVNHHIETVVHQLARLNSQN